MRALLREPQEYLDELNCAAEAGYAYVESELNPRNFNEAWQKLFAPTGTDGATQVDVSSARNFHESSIASRSVQTALQ
jgi:hypothetical protein